MPKNLSFSVCQSLGEVEDFLKQFCKAEHVNDLLLISLYSRPSLTSELLTLESMCHGNLLCP